MNVKLNNITKRFGNKYAVKNLNANIDEGKILGIVGQNGAGKTTTFRMILNFIQPSSGNINWYNFNNESKIRSQIGFLPEERGLYQKWSIEEQIVYFSKLHNMNKIDTLKELDKWMSRLGVIGNKKDKIQTLSKGNAQKVQFIATVIFKPELLILDEPFSGLDPINSSLIMDSIIKLRDQGTSIVFSSHDLEGVEKISDNILMLKNGKTVTSGNPKDIRESFGFKNIYVESDINDETLLSIPGVKSINNDRLGRKIKIENDEVGKAIFKLVSNDGYVKTFSQQPPTLKEVFEKYVQEET
ncbi:ABC transporter ATP-binding protein [Fructobacillus evanidus]|uniref:ATPase component (YhaQ) n=1 Tax=Fructobacillus evanidus TaxID=3064281 RepID=A0ABM9MY32_9LACO|nr:ABC-type uncharacterized transport system [Fructobacillus sp. LMG 32999]CAK1247493.1 ABC-type uncharacterized transport system [Fructobacillus sp. LMG 32999]CAK1248315.1 ABC-type uncharacterized transport system [Fructobacillus sp. LMG 32999]CAK1248867.1 ABC-type uncharacterized transport system [Fructobacillus sp. LMG 32999]CAK1254082.1 ABC-type uncharacterized transport system [Fructobacillus sp. LMG 32999]